MAAAKLTRTSGNTNQPFTFFAGAAVGSAAGHAGHGAGSGHLTSGHGAAAGHGAGSGHAAQVGHAGQGGGGAASPFIAC